MRLNRGAVVREVVVSNHGVHGELHGNRALQRVGQVALGFHHCFRLGRIQQPLNPRLGLHRPSEPARRQILRLNQLVLRLRQALLELHLVRLHSAHLGLGQPKRLARSVPLLHTRPGANLHIGQLLPQFFTLRLHPFQQPRPLHARPEEDLVPRLKRPAVEPHSHERPHSHHAVAGILSVRLEQGEKDLDQSPIFVFHDLSHPALDQGESAPCVQHNNYSRKKFGPTPILHAPPLLGNRLPRKYRATCELPQDKPRVNCAKSHSHLAQSAEGPILVCIFRLSLAHVEGMPKEKGLEQSLMAVPAPHPKSPSKKT